MSKAEENNNEAAMAEEEISEEEENPNAPDETSPLISSKPNKPGRSRSVTTKVPEVEIHLYERGKGPVKIFKSSLGGWDQDQLEILDILEKHGLKMVYAFNPQSGRGFPIRFNAKNGRSMLSYKDGSVVYMDGEPKDSLVSPITKILVGVVGITLLISLALKESRGWMMSPKVPEWAKSVNLPSFNFPPWAIALAVVVFTRLRKRTRDYFRN